MRYLFIHSYLHQLLIKSLNATVDTNQQAQSFVEASLNQRLSSLVGWLGWLLRGPPLIDFPPYFINLF
ncbi:hypothetical protein HanPSC8_Chr03g0121261 [Helianthus annuus]|nr:hypothetical protein HanPSC8_Chr03g0121261 [Helianthus annuus]